MGHMENSGVEHFVPLGEDIIYMPDNTINVDALYEKFCLLFA